MPIIVTLDVMLARRKVRSNELAKAIGISETNLSLLKSGKVKGVKFSTLDAICEFLECQPGDVLEYISAEAPEEEESPPNVARNRRQPLIRLPARR